MMRQLFHLRSLPVPLQANGIRLLFTADALNLNSFMNGKERVKLQFHTPQMQEKFRERMQEFLKTDTNNLIFSEDVKNMVFLAEGNSNDLNILSDMLERYNSQNVGARFASFTFGPVVMRYFYHTNQPLEAVKMLRNPKLIDIFDQFMSYQLVMDMLVKNKLYDEVLEVFTILQSREIRGDKFPKNSFVLAMCALYLQNTPEAFEKMVRLMEELKQSGGYATRRAVTFAAGLAINQRHPDIALNIVSASSHNNYVSNRNLKALAYFKVGRIQDSLTILRTSVDYESPSGGPKRTILSDVFKTIEEGIQASEDKELQLEFDRIRKACISKKIIEEQTLHDILMTPIDKRVENPTELWTSKRTADYGGASRRFATGGFDNSRRRDGFKQNRFPKRPSLADLE